MPPRFQPGAGAYAKDGRRYTVEMVEDGIVYCLAESGAETEFPEAQLSTETERAARAGNVTERLYATLKQSSAYGTQRGKPNPIAATKILQRAEKLVPGILDFAAFVSAERILGEAGHAPPAPGLSIVKCREVFETAPPEARAALLARLIGSPPDVLIGAAELGDNLLRAMLAKAESAGGHSFDAFRTRPRR
jgi:hypothetical protein